jgi:hypothetical protein
VNLVKLHQKQKVQKSYQQFLELEAHIVSVMNQYDNLRKQQARFPILTASKFKQARQVLPSVLAAEAKKQGLKQMSSDKMFLKKVEDLEAFLRVVTGR